MGIVNTYYFGRLQKEDPDTKLALFWPNQEGSGVHINVSGAGVTAYAKHPEAARKLLEWLSSEEAQGDFAALNMEYPVNPQVAADPAAAQDELVAPAVDHRGVDEFGARRVIDTKPARLLAPVRRRLLALWHPRRHPRPVPDRHRAGRGSGAAGGDLPGRHRAGRPLHAIRSGLVHRLSTGDVAGDLGLVAGLPGEGHVVGVRLEL